MIPMPKSAEKEIDDILLTRYACYLIAQNGDSRKEQIKTIIARQIKSVEKAIDTMVYSLYGLNEDKIKARRGDEW